MHFNVKFYIRLSFLYKMMEMKIIKPCFYFCLHYAFVIPLYDFDLGILKIILKKYFWQTLTAQGITIIFYDFKTKWLLIPHGYTCTPLFNLYLFMYLTP